MFLKRLARVTLVALGCPFIFMLIALVTFMRPLSAFRDGFRGPERMWSDVLDWARGLPVAFGHWMKAPRSSLR